MTDYKALIAEARDWSDWTKEGKLLHALADVLEAATVVPAVDREALARVLAELVPGEDWPSNIDLGGHAALGTRDDEFRAAMLEGADRILASGVLRDVRDVQAEALEQAAKAMRSGRDDFYVDVALGGAGFVAEWVDARAQAIREARSERD